MEYKTQDTNEISKWVYLIMYCICSSMSAIPTQDKKHVDASFLISILIQAHQNTIFHKMSSKLLTLKKTDNYTPPCCRQFHLFLVPREKLLTSFHQKDERFGPLSGLAVSIQQFRYQLTYTTEEVQRFFFRGA